jgi:tetratricopeptide (TPR) repeat protein
VRLELARALAEAGRTQRAEELYGAAVEAERRAETPQVEVLNLLGEVASALGRRDDAIRHFTRYLELAPTGAATLTTRQRLRELEAARSRAPVPHP